ncbi:MAG: formaldehyde-activating enzyme [Pseudomonadota bacterium]|jgi:5,6,7,8-tetrahydromethanopterin hydro-lyase
MAQVEGVCVGASQVGDGVELADVDVLIGPRGSAAEAAFAQCLVNQKAEFSSVLVRLAPNLMVKPPCVIYNKASLRHGEQTANFYGPAQRGVARAIADALANGTLPSDEAKDLFMCVGVFLHWQASIEAKIEENNYRATQEALARALCGLPTVSEVMEKTDRFS